MNEHSHEKSLQGKEALDKIRELANEAKSCFFCSDIKTGIPLSVRPMIVLQIDDDGNFWFISKKLSDKNEEIREDPFVHLLFQRDKRSGFLNIYGLSEEVIDQGKIEELWSKQLNVWFDGPDDPSLSLIKVNPLKGHYWDNEHGAAVALFKMATSVITGEDQHDGVQGDLEL